MQSLTIYFSGGSRFELTVRDFDAKNLQNKFTSYVSEGGDKAQTFILRPDESTLEGSVRLSLNLEALQAVSIKSS